MKITVSVTNDLVTDQRVHKVCSTLHENGYQVKLVGRKLKNSKSLERPYHTKRMRLIFNRSFLFFAEYNIRLFFALLKDKSDVLLSNDSDTLLANYLVSKIKRKPLIFDAHELMPETPEVVNRKFVKSFWTNIENWIFPRLKHSYTVCRSIADYYNDKYKIDMQVVRNIPFAQLNNKFSERIINSKGKKIILYQGAVNVGRGIEWVIDAMPYLDDFIFYVIGDGDVLEELKQKVNKLKLNEKVIFTGRIPFDELSRFTQSADIGVNLLDNNGLSYYFSLPNRIFDYIRSGVPVLATDFPEIRRIVKTYQVGKLIDNYQPENLALAIRELAGQEKNHAAFSYANEELTWEKESLTLLKIVKEVK